MGHVRETATTPTKILYFINELDTGGAEVGMCRLFDGLDDDRYEITVVALNGSNPDFVKRIPEKITIIDLTKGRLREKLLVTRLALNADVIVGSLFHSVMVARFWGVLNRTATTVTWQHSRIFKNDIRRRLIGLTNRLCDTVIADSEPVAEMYRNEFRLDEESVKTVPIAGVQLTEFSPRQHQNRETVVVGSVGRLAPPKNYETLVEIAEELSEAHVMFRVAGDGPKRSALEGMIQKKGLNNIELVGEVTDVPEFLSTIDIYVQPSRWEGLCMTVIEAMAAGLPVVASSVGGIEYNVTDGENGYLHQPDDVEGFCKSIQLLAADPDRREEFGMRGRKLVRNNYTQEILVSKFEDII